MRFAWKVFFSCLLVLAAAFSTIVYTLNTNAFDMTLAQEKQRVLDKMNMLMTVVQSFTADFDYDSQNGDLSDVMSSVANGEFASTRLYDKDGVAVYPESALQIPLIQNAQAGIACDVIQNGSDYVMRCCAPVQLGVKTGYLYLEQDITAPFTLSDSMMRTSAAVTIITTAILGLILFSICTLLTQPIRKLSIVTRHMAEGKYQERATITTKDEIGELSSDFNRMADALEAHVQHLEDESRQRENFVTSFAHELKTPLTSIIGYADMLRSQKVDEETHFRSANYIFTEGRRLERLSLKLLELMVLNRQEFERYPVNAADVSVRLWETASSALQEKYGVSLSVDLPDATIYIEPDLFQTMLLNLIDNAGKASKEGQRVSVKGKCCPAGYRISVTDQGMGIPAEELSHITEAFYMVDKSRSRAQNGAGLGLSLCDAIAKLHQTELTFQSELVKGTTVSVFVPYFMEVGDEEA